MLRRHLLWGYDFGRFDFNRSASLVIERVIERGNMEEWREIMRYYGREKILEVARKSRQLDQRDKNFTEIYVYSEFNVV
ncbi:MAG: hypothetical protein ACE5FF_05010 [Saprospiraceae bacterium]